MAKNYSAKLSLKDAGMIATLKKAVAETEKLKKNLQQINKTPVKIEAKVGSSFKNVQAQIRKVAPKTQTVNFVARENITRTISQVERSVFEMNRNISASMSGFTSSINASFGALPNTIGNAMRALNNLNNMNTVGTVMGGANGLLPSVFTGAAAGSLVAGARRTGNQITAALLGEDARINREWANKWKGRFQSISQKIPALKKPLMDALGSMTDRSMMPGHTFSSVGENYAKMITRQMDKINAINEKRQNLGSQNSHNPNILGNYARLSVPMGPDEDFEFIERMPGMYREAFETIGISCRRTFDRVERTIGNAFTNPVQKAKDKFASMFNSAKASSISAFNSIKSVGTSALNAVKSAGTRAFNSMVSSGNRFYTAISNSIIGIASRITTLPRFMQGALMGMTRGFASFASGARRMIIGVGYDIANVFGSARRLASTISNRLQRAFYATQMTATRAWFAIERAGFRAVTKIARSILTIDKAFSKMKQGASRTFSQIASSGENRLNRTAMYIGRSFDRTFGAVGRGFKRMFTRTVTDSDGATRTIQRGWVSMASSVARSIGSSIGGAFTKLQSMGMGVAKAIGAAFTAAIGIGIKGMADRERNLISMRHFLKVGDAKKNGKRTKDDGQINKEADNYMGDLTDFANATPFDTFEVYNAGRRGLQISDGDSKKALDVTKLAGDMAALNPQKTITDAMEALADLKIGQTVRMKEFGFKFSQDDLKKLIGKDPGGETLTSDELEEAFGIMTSEGGEVYKTFTGGAEDLSHSLSGKWSTLWGKFKGMMADAMLPFSDMFKGILDKAVVQIDAFTPQLVAAFGVAKNFVMDLLKGDGSNFPIINNLLASAVALGEGVKPIVDSVMKSFGRMNKSLETGFGGAGGLIQSISEAIGSTLENLTPFFDAVGTICVEVMDIVASVWPTIEDIIVTAGQIIGEACKILDPVIGAIGDVCVAIGNIIAQVWPSVKDTILKVWEVLKPVFELFSEIIQKISNFIRDHWPAIGTIIEGMWAVAEVPLNLMLGVFEGISKAIQWCWDKAKGFQEWWNTTKWNPVNLFGGTPEQNTRNKEASDANTNAMNQGRGGTHATGLDRVPVNGYKAILHEGERVLTARQARQEDANKNNSSSSSTNTFKLNAKMDLSTIIGIL